MREIEINGNRYRIRPMDTFVALDVARKVGPVIGHLFALQGGLLSLQDVAIPLMEGLAKMPDEHFAFVRNACLSTVERFDTANWMFVYNKAANSLQYADIRPRQIVELIVFVLEDTMKDFLGDLPQLGTGGEKATDPASGQ